MPTALSRYVLHLESAGHAPTTVRTYRCVISRWERSELEIVEYLANLNHGTVTASTRAYYGIVLKEYFRWQERCGLLSLSPLEGVRFRRPPAVPVRPFSQVEIDALLAACRCPVERGVILCLLRLGLRASELAGIEADDVGTDVVIIRKAKGGKERVLAVGPLLGPLEAICGAGLRYQAVYRMVKGVGRRAGVAGCHPHRMRHTFADAYLRAGGDRGDLRVLLGHSSYVMVDRYCAFFESERAVAAHQRFLEAG